MTINKITGDFCRTARPLWEEVFYEDSVQFTDYYFENKAEQNIGYVIGQVPYEAMMFRTPYQIQIGQARKEISYIVGVATREKCRHRGYMRKLLMHSFREMYQEKNPFTFLMPANPAIYEPFDFQYIYERDIWELTEPGKIVPFLETLTSEVKVTEYEGIVNIESGIRGIGNENKKADYELTAAEAGNSNLTECKRLSESDNWEREISFHKLTGLYSVRSLVRQFPDFPIMDLLAEFANNYLKEHYNIYVHRDAFYYKMQLKESKAQNGDIYVLFEKGEIKAFFVYAKEGDEIFLQEVLESEEGILGFLQKAEKKKPIIMARIIHLEEMMKLVCSREHNTTMIEIKDELIPENAGIYRWEITPWGSKVKKVAGEINLSEKDKVKTGKSGVSMHIKELAVKILTGVFINEIV